MGFPSKRYDFSLQAFMVILPLALTSSLKLLFECIRIKNIKWKPQNIVLWVCPIEWDNHVLWVWPIPRAVWKIMLYHVYGKQVYTWGFVRWGRWLKKYTELWKGVCWFSSPLWWNTSIGCPLYHNNPLFGGGQGFVYDILFSSLGIVEGNM